jgi:hypothetical protein
MTVRVSLSLVVAAVSLPDSMTRRTVDDGCVCVLHPGLALEPPTAASAEEVEAAVADGCPRSRPSRTDVSTLRALGLRRVRQCAPAAARLGPVGWRLSSLPAFSLRQHAEPLGYCISWRGQA